MRWILHQMREHVTESWWLIGIGLAVFFAAVSFLGPLEAFTFALVLGTLLLAWVTAFLATANQSLADSAARTELRDALEAARKFVEIEPAALLDVLKGESRFHPFLDAIDQLASYGNKLHNLETERDLQQFALEMDQKRIGSAALVDIKDKLAKLQAQVVQEMVLMRRDLRDLTREYLYP